MTGNNSEVPSSEMVDALVVDPDQARGDALARLPQLMPNTDDFEG